MSFHFVTISKKEHLDIVPQKLDSCNNCHHNANSVTERINHCKEEARYSNPKLARCQFKKCNDESCAEIKPKERANYLGAEACGFGVVVDRQNRIT